MASEAVYPTLQVLLDAEKEVRAMLADRTCSMVAISQRFMVPISAVKAFRDRLPEFAAVPTVRGRRPDPGREKRDADWIAQAQAGVTCREIGAKYGVTGERVRSRLRELGVGSFKDKERTASYRSTAAEQMIPLLRQGLSLREIAVQFDIPLNEVEVIIQKATESGNKELIDAKAAGQAIIVANTQAVRRTDAARRQLLADIFGHYKRWSDLKASDLNHHLGISYTIVSCFLNGHRTVTARSWTMLATMMPAMGEFPSREDQIEPCRTRAMRILDEEERLEMHRRGILARALRLANTTGERAKAIRAGILVASIDLWDEVGTIVGAPVGDYPVTPFIAMQIRRRAIIRDILVAAHPSLSVVILCQYTGLTPSVCGGLIDADLDIPQNLWEMLRNIIPEIPPYPATEEHIVVLEQSLKMTIAAALDSQQVRSTRLRELAALDTPLERQRRDTIATAVAKHPLLRTTAASAALLRACIKGGTWTSPALVECAEAAAAVDGGTPSA